jgi:protein-tyrosine phosphatase
MTDAPPRIGVLFVCYANVCRSPLAEGVFRHLVQARGVADRFEIDSAGTAAFEGASPHPFSVDVAREAGISVAGGARQLLRTDLARFDHVLLMDRFNRDELRRMAGAAVFAPDSGLRARIRLLREAVDPELEELEIPDPVGKEREHYDATYRLVREACEALLDELLREP